MEKLTQVLKSIEEIFVREGEREFTELRRRDRRAIYDILEARADDSDTDGDGDGTYETFEFGDRDIQIFSRAQYSYEIRDHLDALYVDEDQSDDTLGAIRELLSELAQPVTVYNLTPHDVVIVDDAGATVTVFIATGQTARVNSEAVELAPVAGVPVVRTVYGSIDGLPEPQPNTVYIVSIVVAQALKTPRPDVYVPDTGPASVVRDPAGRIIGVKRLMQI